MSYTRGPWGILELGTLWCVVPFTADGDIRGRHYTEAFCEGSTIPKNWEENAALIAEAPTMFKMLQRMRIACETAPPPWYKTALKRQIEEVLKRAQGIREEEK